MSYFPNVKDIVGGASPNEWIALTMAEHCEQSAQSASERIADLVAASANDSLEVTCNQFISEVEDLKIALSEQITTAAQASEIDLATVDRSSQEFHDFVKDVYDNSIASGALPSAWLSELDTSERLSYDQDPYTFIMEPTSDDIIAVANCTWDALNSIVIPEDLGFDALIDVGGGYVSNLRMKRLMSLSAEIDPSPMVYNALLRVEDAQGNLISDLTPFEDKLSPDGFIEYLASATAASLCVAGGLRSMVFDTISDRVAQFSNYVQIAGEGLVSKASGVLSATRSKIADLQSSAADAVDYFLDIMGLQAIANGTGTVRDSEMYQYQGATPIPAFNIAVCKGVLMVLGGAVAVAGYGIWQSAKAAWKKVKTWGTNLVGAFTAPSDLDVVDSPLRSKRGYVDQWQWSVNATVRHHLGTLEYGSVTKRVKSARHIIDRYNDMLSAGGGVAVRLHSGEFINQPYDTSSIYVDDQRDITIDQKIRVLFKPACLNVEYVYEAIQNSTVTDVDTVMVYDDNQRIYRVFQTVARQSLWTVNTCKNVMSFFSDLFAHPEAYYSIGSDDAQIDEDDTRAVMGWLLGYALSGFLMCTLAHYISAYEITSATGNTLQAWMNQRLASTGDMTIGVFPVPDYSGVNFSVVSNGNLIAAASGWNEDPANPVFGGLGTLARSSMFQSHYQDILGAYVAGTQYSLSPALVAQCVDIDLMGTLLTAIQIDQKLDQFDHPDDFMYFPYSKSVTTWSIPDWVIRTDAANIQLATALTATIGTVMLVALATIAVKAITKSLTRRKFFKWTQIQGRLDNAMWNGAILDRSQQRQYRKAIKKLGRIQLVSDVVDAGARSTLQDTITNAKSAAARSIPLVNAICGTSFTAPDLTAEDPTVTFSGVQPAFDQVFRVLGLS